MSPKHVCLSRLLGALCSVHCALSRLLCGFVLKSFDLLSNFNDLPSFSAAGESHQMGLSRGSLAGLSRDSRGTLAGLSRARLGLGHTNPTDEALKPPELLPELPPGP